MSGSVSSIVSLYNGEEKHFKIMLIKFESVFQDLSEISGTFLTVDRYMYSFIFGFFLLVVKLISAVVCF